MSRAASARTLTRALLALAIALAPALPAQSQTPSAPPPSPVTLNFSVLDSTGAFVPNLSPQDLLLSENGKPQAVSTLTLDDSPLSIALLIDEFCPPICPRAQIRPFIESFVKNFGPGTEFFLMPYFSNKVTLTGPLKGPNAVLQYLSALAAPAVTPPTAGERVPDVVSFALDTLAAQASNSRRIIVIFSDSVDVQTEKKFNALLKRVRSGREVIYAVSPYMNFKDRLIWFPFGHTHSPIGKLTAASGGTTLLMGSPDTTDDRAAHFARIISSSYSLTYFPTAPPRKGNLKVKLTLRRPPDAPKLLVLHRPELSRQP